MRFIVLVLLAFLFSCSPSKNSVLVSKTILETNATYYYQAVDDSYDTTHHIGDVTFTTTTEEYNIKIYCIPSQVYSTWVDVKTGKTNVTYTRDTNYGMSLRIESYWTNADRARFSYCKIEDYLRQYEVSRGDYLYYNKYEDKIFYSEKDLYDFLRR